MVQGLYPLSGAMVNQLNRIDTISNNLANANTNGFKQELIQERSFNHYLERMQQEGKSPEYINELTNMVPKLQSKYINNDNGAIHQTGNQLDFALKQKDTFFAVLNENGDTQYTRDGAFKNLDGFLVDSNGNTVLTADGGPIAVEEGFELAIGVFQVPIDNLEKFGNNNYNVKEDADAIPIPLPENDGFVIQGAVEKSNINMVNSMVGLIEAQKRFETAQKFVTGIDEMNKNVIQKLGDNK